jgi:hypothetical protein
MKHIILTLILLLGGLAARAENVVSVSSASGHPQDEVTLNVSLANTDVTVAFQAEIPLGNQLTYVAGSVALNPSRVTDHQVSAAVVGGSLRIYVYSLSLTPFVDNSGNLLSFTLRLKNEPGYYALDMGSAKLSDASGTALPVNTSNGTVTILSPKLQINTTSINYGHVPIRNEYYQDASLTNVGNEPLVITGIAFSDAVFSCPSFTETTLAPGNSANFSFKFAPIVKGAVIATATIVSNSISDNSIIHLNADPFAVNEIHIGNILGYCDSIVTLPISMNNMEAIMGFQIDMNLPDALEYVDFTLSDRKADHVSMGVFNEGQLRLMAYSGSGSVFTGDDGLIGTLRLRLKGMYGYYYLNPFKVVLADTNGEDVLSDKYQGYVEIRSPRINGNNALSFGSSPVTEIVTKEYVVNNNGNAPMRIDQVVFDQLDFSVAELLPIVVEQGNSTTLHVSYNHEQAGNFNALMKIYSNDPENGLKTVTVQGHRFEPNTIALSADPFNLGNGDVEVALSMNNYTGIVALQADFQYPYQDYSVAASDFVLTERFAGHSLYALPLNDSTYRIIVLSMLNSSVEGNQGAVLNVTLHPIATPAEEQYSVSVSQIVLSESEGRNVFSGQSVTVSFSLAAASQTIELAEGWNWWAPMVYVSLQQLQEALADKGIAINSQSSGSSHRTGATWTGDLQRIIPGQMYRIQANQACNIDLSGMSVASSSVNLHPGLTWFGYIDAQKPIAQALSGFQPAIGDMINSQSDGFAIYGSNGWSGTLQRLQTGLGYNYLSAAANTKTLSFGASYSNSYTTVDYIWSEIQQSNDNTWIDTEINLNNISKVRCKMKPMAATGGIWLGNCIDDSHDFRLFATSLNSNNAYVYFDFKNRRSSSSNTNFRYDTEIDLTIEITSSYTYVYLTEGGSTSNYMYRVNNYGTYLDDANYWAVINYIKLGILQIWDANGVLVRDLNAALDSEGTPCMYDEVNKEFIYKSGVDRTMYYE